MNETPDCERVVAKVNNRIRLLSNRILKENRGGSEYVGKSERGRPTPGWPHAANNFTRPLCASIIKVGHAIWRGWSAKGRVVESCLAYSSPSPKVKRARRCEEEILPFCSPPTCSRHASKHPPLAPRAINPFFYFKPFRQGFVETNYKRREKRVYRPSRSSSSLFLETMFLQPSLGEKNIVLIRV